MQRYRSVPPKARFSFVWRIAAAVWLLALSDLLFFGYRGGAVIGAFALAWLVVLVMSKPAIRRARHARIAIGASAFFALALIDDPSLLAVLLFLTAIGSAALLPGHAFDHAGRWSARLLALAAKGPFRVVLDLSRTARLPSRGGCTARSICLHIALPIGGGGLFLALFANANPVLGNALSSIRLPDAFTLALHVILLAVVLSLVWPSLRPRAIRYAPANAIPRAMRADTPTTAIIVTLAVFNAIFAIENALDIAFLWSRASLPPGVTLADYAHRGAYTLIVTVLMAAAFVLIALRPGSSAAKNAWVRSLLLVWIAQNILLVASSVLRLVDYVDAYSLTVLRICALAWMGLVAIGLLLVCWRLFAERSAAWLINANTLAAMIVLSLASVVDLGAVSAAWNVRHTKDPVKLDLCYLQSLGSSSLIPLIRLRDAPVGSAMQDRAVYLSNALYGNLQTDQAHWQGWTLRGARRLAQADRMLADDPRVAMPAPYGRTCDGAVQSPPKVYDPPVDPEPQIVPVELPDPKPLTPEQKR
ncbi:MAG: DUF4173 domain-containing protein [Pseudomonadota bacterium]|jgi:hypothetical protein|nr:DUF4173 domain-containing protein [Pseudomonadota bacterium]